MASRSVLKIMSLAHYSLQHNFWQYTRCIEVFDNLWVEQSPTSHKLQLSSLADVAGDAAFMQVVPKKCYFNENTQKALAN